MTQTVTNDGTQGFDPKLQELMPSGSEMHDAIMGSIEPELMISELPKLADKYKDEAPDQTKVRMQRYKSAFQKYDVSAQKLLGTMSKSVETYKTSVMQRAVKESKERDAGKLEALEKEMNGDSPHADWLVS